MGLLEGGASELIASHANEFAVEARKRVGGEILRIDVYYPAIPSVHRARKTIYMAGTKGSFNRLLNLIRFYFMTSRKNLHCWNMKVGELEFAIRTYTF